MKFLLLILLTISVNCFAASKFDDPDLEDTVFVCEESLIPQVTRQALQMPVRLQEEMSRAYQRQKRKEHKLNEEREIQAAMADAFSTVLEENFKTNETMDLPRIREITEHDQFEEVYDDQIEQITDSEIDIKFDDPVWFEENIKKPFAKLRAKEEGVEYKDTGDLKKNHEDFFKTPVGIVLKKLGIVF